MNKKTNGNQARDLAWSSDTCGVDWQELSELYRIAPLGNKSAESLRIRFANSRFTCIVRDGDRLVGAGRAVADGEDVSYLCDVVVHPDLQGQGIGKRIIDRLVEASRGHKKIILYANPGKEGFYSKFGFRRMKTAMAIFSDNDQAIKAGILESE